MASWKEFLTKNQGVDLTGKRVWVTDTRLNEGLTLRRIRSLPPTLVEILRNDDLPKHEKVYQSEYHFRKVGKNGELLKQVIKPYDSTSYRTHRAVALHVFETEELANEKHNQQLEVVVEQLKQSQNEIQKAIDKTLSERK